MIDDGGQPVAQLGEMLDGFFDAMVGHIVGRRLGAQDEMVADVLLNEAIAVVAADDRVGQLDIFDLDKCNRWRLGDRVREEALLAHR